MSQDVSLAERYGASFEELRYAVRLLDRFALIPVECPDRAVAEALATALRESGYSVSVHAPTGAAWENLAEELEHLPLVPDRIYLVYGDEVTPPAQRGLALLNQLRDRLGPALGAPLLWCGPARFLEASWAAMPDLWSVRALTVRLVPSTVELPSERHSERLWFREGTRTESELWASLAAARSQGDPAAAARLVEALACTLAAARRTDDAIAVLAENPAPEPTFERARTEALLALKLGRAERAREAATQAGEGGEEWARAQLRAAFCSDEGEAQRILTEALAVADAFGAANLHASRADLRAARGDLTGAQEDWTAAAAGFLALGDRWGAAVAEEALAAIASAGDRGGDAREHRGRAAALYEACGDADNAARMRGAPPGGTEPDAPDPPDPRVQFAAARTLAKKHPRSEQIRARLAAVGAERTAVDRSASPVLAWTRVLGGMAREGHPALGTLLDEGRDGESVARPPLSWLQISGLQCGGPGLRARRGLLEDACRHAAELGTPDAVFVLGDVTAGSAEGDFAEARAWLTDLADAVGVGAGRIFVVPGPRDLASSPEAEEALARHRARPLYVDEAFREPDPTHADRDAVRARRLADRASLWRRLAGFGAFSGAWGHPALVEARPFWTAAIGEIRILGLDSVLLATGMDGPGSLALGMSQLEVVARLPMDTPLVVLSHHGADQLADGTLLSGLLSQRPHVLLHTGDVPFLGYYANRLLGEIAVRTKPDGDAPGVVWGRLERTGLSLWHRRWDDATEAWTQRDRTVTRPREELPPALDRWLPGAPTPPPAPIAALRTGEGADFDPSRPYVYLPFNPPETGMVGRDGELDRMRVALATGEIGALGRTLALVGMGGLGKTRLVFEYARTFAHLYPGGVYVFHADTDVEGQLIQLAERARWVSPLSDRASAMMIVSRRIRQARDALLVFDNLDDLGRIRAYLPPAQAGCHILVTSRVEQPGFPSMAPGLLDAEQSRRLLEVESGRPPRGDADITAVAWVAERLDGLPLALELAAAWMRRHREMAWPEYRGRLEAEGLGARELRDRAFQWESATTHVNDLRRTLRVTQGVFAEAPLLRQVLDLLAWSGPGTITTALVAAVLEVEPEALTRAIEVGSGVRILKVEGDGVAIHRLVGEVRRGDVALDPEWARGVIARMGAWFEERREEFENLRFFEANAEHLAAWEGHAGEIGETVGGARLAWMRGVGPGERGAYGEAEGHLRRALEGIERSGNVETVLGARVRGAFAEVVWHLGTLEEATRLLRKAWEVLHRHQSAGAVERAVAQCGLGSALVGLAKFEEARPHIRHAVDALEEQASAPKLATGLSVLADLELKTGRYEAALSLYERAVALCTGHGPNPTLATLHDSRAQCLSFLGRPVEARVEAETAAGMLADTVGPRHPRRGIALMEVGRALLATGSTREAHAALNEALALVEASAPNHPDLSIVLDSLAECEARLGNVTAARSLGQRALAQAEAVYGASHPQTGGLMANIAARAARTERLDLFLQARVVMVAAFGEAHPKAATNLINIGLSRLSLGEIRQGLSDLQRGVTLRGQALGSDHPETFQGLATLGLALGNAGQFPRALPALERALAGQTRLLGREHPTTLQTLTNLAITLSELGRTTESLQRAAEALTLSLNRHGPSHPDTAAPRLALARLLAKARREADAINVLDQGLAALPAGTPAHTELKALRDRIRPPVKLKPAR